MSYRLPSIYDQVLVTDSAGHRSLALVTGVARPGDPSSPLMVRATAGLTIDFSRPLLYDAACRPLTWRWPAGTGLADGPGARASGQRIPITGDHVLTVFQGLPVAGLVEQVVQPGRPESDLVLTIFPTNRPAEHGRRASYNPDAGALRFGEWTWPPAA